MCLFVDVLEVCYGEEKTRNAMCCVTFIIAALLLRIYALTWWPGTNMLVRHDIQVHVSKRDMIEKHYMTCVNLFW